MKHEDIESSICEPHEVMREADEMIAIVKANPPGEPLRKAVAIALSNMANSGEITVWAGIDGFLRGIIASGNVQPHLLPGVQAVQRLVAESYADVLARLRQKMQEAGVPMGDCAHGERVH